MLYRKTKNADVKAPPIVNVQATKMNHQGKTVPSAPNMPFATKVLSNSLLSFSHLSIIESIIGREYFKALSLTSVLIFLSLVFLKSITATKNCWGGYKCTDQCNIHLSPRELQRTYANHTWIFIFVFRFEVDSVPNHCQEYEQKETGYSLTSCEIAAGWAVKY